MDAAALRRLWPDVLDVVKQSSRRTRALLDNAQIAGLSGDRLTVSAPTAPLVRMIGEDSNTKLLRDALTSVVGGSWTVSVELTGGAIEATAPPTPVEPGSRGSVIASEPDPRDDSEPEPPVDESSSGDPEADALSLLQSALGARPIEDA